MSTDELTAPMRDTLRAVDAEAAAGRVRAPDRMRVYRAREEDGFEDEAFVDLVWGEIRATLVEDGGAALTANRRVEACHTAEALVERLRALVPGADGRQ